jgi:hypothetical protein
MDDSARKKLAHVIAIGIEPAGGEKGDSKEPESGGPDAGLVAAMEEFHTAFGKKDFAGMAEAFHSAHALCASGPSDYEAETGDHSEE